MCELLEVFSVSHKGGDGAAPSGTISVFDGKSGQIIYRRGWGHANEENVVQLVLTGPYRAISADGCVAIELDLHHHCKNTYVAQILVDVYDTSTKYDEALTKEVHTCKCKDGPRAEVKYALLSDAVEAVVEVKLLRKRDDPAAGCCCVKGKIIARCSDLGEVVLFESNNDNTRIRSSQGLTTIPLTRSVLAVPSMSSLTIEVDLRGHSNIEIVKGSRECQADLDSEHVLSFAGENGDVQVKITCSD